MRLVLLLVVLLEMAACSAGGGRGDDTGPAPSCSGGTAVLPPDLGLVDDDDLWLCGDRRPEDPHEDPDLGVVVAGVSSCLAGASAPVPGDHVYVGPEGKETNPGTTPAEPLASVATALCRLRPGQTLHILPGTYREGVAIGGLGADDRVTTIRGEASGPDQVILEGDFWRSSGLYLVESRNVTVANLTLQHYSDAGLIALTSRDIAIEGIVARDNGRCSVDPDSRGEGFGINILGTSGVRIEGSTFDHNGPLLSPVLCGDVLGTGIDTFETSGTIRNNTITRTRGGAILVEDGGPTLVEGNRGERNFLLALDNYWDAGLWVDGSRDVTARNNTFTASYGGVGIMVTDEEGSYPDRSIRTRIEGNRVRGHLAGVLVWGYGSCPPPSDAILDYAGLEGANDLAGNTFGETPHPVWCAPEFLGGLAPP